MNVIMKFWNLSHFNILHDFIKLKIIFVQLQTTLELKNYGKTMVRFECCKIKTCELFGFHMIDDFVAAPMVSFATHLTFSFSEKSFSFPHAPTSHTIKSSVRKRK